METFGGSSPLARGLRGGAAVLAVGGRIIPARAGFTRRRLSLPAWGADHPRSRGVYPCMRASNMAFCGSSPLARGLRGPAEPAARANRIIPARAGFTSTSRCSIKGGRIIPARAGFTQPPASARRPRADHPRSRGVYSRASQQTSQRVGSSPLARGLRHQLSAPLPGPRIIPARAGFTRRSSSRSSHRWDHPRSRGVYASVERRAVLRPGSSPLARGLPRWSAVRPETPGIIPARAGFTHHCRNHNRRHPDHPRSRGVYKTRCSSSSRAFGSSPLARGLPR